MLEQWNLDFLVELMGFKRSLRYFAGDQKAVEREKMRMTTVPSRWGAFIPPSVRTVTAAALARLPISKNIAESGFLMLYPRS